MLNSYQKESSSRIFFTRFKKMDFTLTNIQILFYKPG